MEFAGQDLRMLHDKYMEGQIHFQDVVSGSPNENPSIYFTLDHTQTSTTPHQVGVFTSFAAWLWTHGKATHVCGSR